MGVGSVLYFDFISLLRKLGSVKKGAKPNGAGSSTQQPNGKRHALAGKRYDSDPSEKESELEDAIQTVASELSWLKLSPSGQWREEAGLCREDSDHD